MFGPWGKESRRKKAAEKLVSELRAGTKTARAALEAVPPGDRPDVVAHGLHALAFDDAYELADELATCALELNVTGDDARHAIVNVLLELGDHERAATVCERALDDDPFDEAWVLKLALTLIRESKGQEALELLDEAAIDSDAAALCRIKALSLLDRREEALELAQGVCVNTERRMKHSFDAQAWELAKRQHTEAEELRVSLHAELYGAESVVVSAAKRGVLDARVGSNYRLLAESLMVEEREPPAVCYLQTPDETLARCAKHDGAIFHALRGSAELRTGRVDRARRSFEAACAADPRHFAGLRGLGAVVDHEQHELWERAQRLPELTLSQNARRVVADHAALTERELRVVAASVAPLEPLLAPLVTAGAVIRLLPIDVRTVDLPEWRRASGDRALDDHRALDALGGVADPEAQLAAARIEELLDVVTQSSFTFAHELAHLAFFHARPALIERVRALYGRALLAPHLAGEYQLSNEHEFFAISYQDYVRMLYGMPAHRIPDDEGVLEDTFALFERPF